MNSVHSQPINLFLWYLPGKSLLEKTIHTFSEIIAWSLDLWSFGSEHSDATVGLSKDDDDDNLNHNCLSDIISLAKDNDC